MCLWLNLRFKFTDLGKIPGAIEQREKIFGTCKRRKNGWKFNRKNEQGS